MECAMWLGVDSWFIYLYTRLIRRCNVQCSQGSHDWMEQAWFCNMWTLPIYADFQFRQVLPFPFILITLSSLAIPTKSFLFSPFSFYEGIQDLDSMARNIQYFHPEPESTVSCRSWPLVIFHLPSSSCTILGSPVFIPQSCPLALSWDIAPPLLLVLF